MPKTRPPYALEFRRQMIELVRAGRDPAGLAREFEPSAQAIHNWVLQAELVESRREAKPAAPDTALSAARREELARLRRENKQLRLERDILSRAAAWFAREAGMIAGFLYRAVVLDMWSRRVVGGRRPTNLRAELVLDALERAVGQRRPKDVIHYSGHGSQYTSVAFGKRCKEAGVRPSMGSVGDAYDNAMCESFFATLECELLDRRRFASQAKARVAVFSYIEGFYNPVRYTPPWGIAHPSATKERC